MPSSTYRTMKRRRSRSSPTRTRRCIGQRRRIPSSRQSSDTEVSRCAIAAWATTQYRTRLEARGFSVTSIQLFPRPTPLPGDGVNWLELFAQPFLEAVSDADQPSLLDEVRSRLESQIALTMTETRDEQAGGSALWRLMAVAVRVFYRVAWVGPALPGGPLVLVANHPNALLDPAVIHALHGAKGALDFLQIAVAIVQRLCVGIRCGDDDRGAADPVPRQVHVVSRPPPEPVHPQLRFDSGLSSARPGCRHLAQYRDVRRGGPGASQRTRDLSVSRRDQS